MPEIHHQLTIKGTASKVFEAVSTPHGLNSWWTLDCKVVPKILAEFDLIFPEPFHWQAIVSKFVKNKLIEFTATKADEDWTGQKFGFELTEKDGQTTLRFYQKTWKENSDHYRVYSYCWAIYLRLLKRYVENGEVAEYQFRND